MAPRESDLGGAELEVLQALWDHGPATVRQVLILLHKRGRKVAYTTVLTFLTRLEQKGYAHSDRSGMAYVYRPVVSRENVTRSRLRALIEQLYGGSAAPLVLQLMRQEKFSAKEIAELQHLVDQLDSRTRRSRPKS